MTETNPSEKNKSCVNETSFLFSGNKLSYEGRKSRHDRVLSGIGENAC